MDKFKQYLLATAGLVIVIGAVTLFNPVQITGAPPEILQGNVTVINTPLPVTGNVTGTVTGSVDANVTNMSLNVDAAQSGTWNVGITNDENNPVPVEDVSNQERRGFVLSPQVTTGFVQNPGALCRLQQ